MASKPDATYEEVLSDFHDQRQRRERAEDGLRKYAAHRPACVLSYSQSVLRAEDWCTCGLTKLRREIWPCEEIIALRERVAELEADAETWDQTLRSVATKLAVLGNTKTAQS